MPNYLVEIKYRYPVCAVNAKDAFNTVPGAVKIKWPHAEGEAEVINTADGKTELRAALKGRE